MDKEAWSGGPLWGMSFSSRPLGFGMRWATEYSAFSGKARGDKAQHIIPIQVPMLILTAALLSLILMLVHMTSSYTLETPGSNV